MRPLTLALLAAVALVAACGDDEGGGSTVATASPPGAASPANGGVSEELVELALTAENTRLDKDRLQAPAASEVSLTFENRDSVEHNFSLYESEGSEAPLFEGSLLPGPSFLIYQFTAPEVRGTYRFQCDVHPDAMNGDFIVE